jgi:hypothetical protein
LIDLDVRRLPKAILVAVVSVLPDLLGRLAARLVVAWAGIGGVELFAFYFRVAARREWGWDNVKLAGFGGGVLAYLSWGRDGGRRIRRPGA